MEVGEDVRCRGEVGDAAVEHVGDVLSCMTVAVAPGARGEGGIIEGVREQERHGGDTLVGSAAERQGVVDIPPPIDHDAEEGQGKWGRPSAGGRPTTRRRS